MADAWKPKSARQIDVEWRPKSARPVDVATPPDASQSQPERVDSWTALGRGAGQGATLGLSDEINGLVQALGVKYLPASMGGGGGQAQQLSLADLYRQNRDYFRRDNQAAEDQHKTLYMAGNIAGGLPAAIATGGGAGATLRSLAGTGTALGMVEGLGFSNADLTRGDIQNAAIDTGAGGLFGLGASLVPAAMPEIAGAAGRKLLRGAASRTERAQAKAAQMAADAVAEDVKSARSYAGRTAQDAYKQLEHLRELGAVRNLGPEERVTFDELSTELAGKAQANLLPAAAEKKAAAQTLSDLMANQGNAAEAKTAELLRPSFRNDAWTAFRQWGEPALGTIAGSWAGDELFDSPKMGATLGMMGGLLFGRTRAGKGIAQRFAKPGNQMAIANAQRTLGQMLANSDGTFLRTLGKTPEGPRFLNSMLPRYSTPSFGQSPVDDDSATAALIRSRGGQ